MSENFEWQHHLLKLFGFDLTVLNFQQYSTPQGQIELKSAEVAVSHVHV